MLAQQTKIRTLLEHYVEYRHLHEKRSVSRKTFLSNALINGYVFSSLIMVLLCNLLECKVYDKFMSDRALTVVYGMLFTFKELMSRAF